MAPARRVASTWVGCWSRVDGGRDLGHLQLVDTGVSGEIEIKNMAVRRAGLRGDGRAGGRRSRPARSARCRPRAARASVLVATGAARRRQPARSDQRPSGSGPLVGRARRVSPPPAGYPEPDRHRRRPARWTSVGSPGRSTRAAGLRSGTRSLASCASPGSSSHGPDRPVRRDRRGAGSVDAVIDRAGRVPVGRPSSSARPRHSCRPTSGCSRRSCPSKVVGVGKNYADARRRDGQRRAADGPAALPQAVHLGDRPRRRDPLSRAAAPRCTTRPSSPSSSARLVRATSRRSAPGRHPRLHLRQRRHRARPAAAPTGSGPGPRASTPSARSGPGSRPTSTPRPDLAIECSGRRRAAPAGPHQPD